MLIVINYSKPEKNYKIFAYLYYVYYTFHKYCNTEKIKEQR